MDIDTQIELQREAHENPPAPSADAPEWADTEEPRPFHGFCAKCGISLLRRGPNCARCAFNDAVLALTVARADAVTF